MTDQTTTSKPKRVLAPYDDGCEKIFVGTLLQQPELITRYCEIVRPEHIFVSETRKLYETILDVFISNRDFSSVEVARSFHEKVKASSQDASYSKTVDTIINEYVNNAVWEAIIEDQIIPKLKRYHLHRRLIQEVYGIEKEVTGENFRPTAEIVETYADRLSQLGAVNEAQERLVTARDMSLEFVIPNRAEIEAATVHTGLHDLDHRVNLFIPGQMAIVAGRPSMGKSTLAREIVYNASERAETLVCSLEEDPTMFHSKLICGDARIDFDRFSKGFLNDDDAARLNLSNGVIQSRHIHYYKNFFLSFQTLRMVIKRLKSRGVPLRSVVIDYLGLMQHPYTESRQLSIAETTRQLKLMAGDLEISVICLAQLNRQVESRDEGRPKLSDLRESGAIEQDADVVIFIWQKKDDEEMERGPSPTVSRTLSVSKNRSGPTGEFDVTFNRSIGRIFSMAAYAPPAPALPPQLGGM